MELIADYTINIPIIQRDYAQGRPDEKTKREKFLGSIFKHLTQSIPQDLDFIYGRISDKTFFPIDGQQRLTTLFLIHWYMSIKAGVEKNTKDKLAKFVYDTRISSREFCKAIINQQIEIPSIIQEDNFIHEIQENHWFRNSWKNDPTIIAMLTMIQAIHEKFHNEPADQIWERLIKERIISFQVLDLGAKGFELTDELYIKMNARGKQLTPFENFKANFIQFLEKTYKEKEFPHPIKSNELVSYSYYFSYKIEKDWTDLFWAFRAVRIVIDDMFMNYFSYISQMCYFQSHKDAKAEDFTNTTSQYEEIFSKKENILFLFNSLDKFFEISTNNRLTERSNLDLFFNSIFQKGKIDEEYNGEVRLFWNKDTFVNPFDNIINIGLDENGRNKDDARNKIILFCTIYYLMKYDSIEIDNILKHYIRVVRNLLQATRQRDETRYITNIRINNFGNYWQLFELLATKDVFQTILQTINNKGSQISDQSLNNEKIKANLLTGNRNRIINNADRNSVFLLEEFSYFGGLIHQLKPEENYVKFRKYAVAIREIWSTEHTDTQIVQALIACGFEGVYNKWCKMGNLWSFGNKGNWDFVLTYINKDNNDKQQEKLSENIIALLDKYIESSALTSSEKLKEISRDWIESHNTDRSWKHYFMKYPEFTSKLNYYVKPNDYYEIRLLGTEGSSPLMAYHISPYVKTVCGIINNKKVCEEGDCYQQYSGNSPLILKNGITLSSTQNGWLVDNKAVAISKEIEDKYHLERSDNLYILKEINNSDRIEVAIDFINDIVKAISVPPDL
jgi:hypothetical protein